MRFKFLGILRNLLDLVICYFSLCFIWSGIWCCQYPLHMFISSHICQIILSSFSWFLSTNRMSSEREREREREWLNESLEKSFGILSYVRMLDNENLRRWSRFKIWKMWGSRRNKREGLWVFCDDRIFHEGRNLQMKK